MGEQDDSVLSTELRAVGMLQTADVLQVSSDRRLYRVLSVGRAAGDADARCKVTLVSLDGTASAMVVRAGRELVRVVRRMAGVEQVACGRPECANQR